MDTDTGPVDHMGEGADIMKKWRATAVGVIMIFLTVRGVPAAAGMYGFDFCGKEVLIGAQEA